MKVVIQSIERIISRWHRRAAGQRIAAGQNLAAGQPIAAGQRIGQRIIALCLVALLSWGMTGCSESQLRSQAARIPRLILTSLSDPSTFNSIVSSDASTSAVIGFLYSGLLETDGETGKLSPGLAESYTVSDDRLRITFTMREGLKWSDGQPLTVDDVVFHYNDIVFNPNIPSGTADIFRIGAKAQFPIVRKLNDRQVEFVSPEPFAPLLRFAGGSFLPKHALEQAVKATDASGNPFLSTWSTDAPPESIITSGPYQLKRFIPSQRVILERNPNYWKKDAQGQPLPYIDQVVIQTVGSQDTSMMQFRSGGTDMEEVPVNNFALLKREEERGNFTIYEGGPTTFASFITFNLNKGRINGKPVIDPIKSRWFNTLAFRQAVAHAIDRPTMINNISQGLGELQNSPLYSGSPYALKPEEGLPVYNFNQEKAKQLLQSAGFKYTPQGQLLDSDGNPVRFTLTLSAESQRGQLIAAQIKNDLSKIGITVDLQAIAFNTLIAKTDNTLDWEALILSIGGAPFDPDGGKNTWSPDGTLHVFNQKPAGNQTIEGREVAPWEQEIYQLYVEGGQQFDDVKRKEIYGRAQKIIQANLPFIYLTNSLVLGAVRNTVQNAKFSGAAGGVWNYDELKLEP